MMSLPSLAPRDSYSLWYSSSTSSGGPRPPNGEGAAASFEQHAGGPIGGTNSTRRTAHRGPLAQLRLDEENIERRKQNIQDYGGSWIRPPGIPKSLLQLREERRELEEHREAMRREALAQELAEAEAEEAAEAMGDLEQDLEGMPDEMETERDLDDDVPEAEGMMSEDEDEDSDDSDDDEDDDNETLPPAVIAAHMPEEAFRAALIRGEEARGSAFGEEGAEEHHEGMLLEEDLFTAAPVHPNNSNHATGARRRRSARRSHHSRPSDAHTQSEMSVEDAPLDMDMHIDLDIDMDADVPSAEGYEHTDTELELSTSSVSSRSSTSGENEVIGTNSNHANVPRDSQRRRSNYYHQQRAPARSSMVRSDGTQNSMDSPLVDELRAHASRSLLYSSPAPGSATRRQQGQQRDGTFRRAL